MPISEVTTKKLFIDLFCGSSSFKAEAEAAGFEYFGVDWKPYDNVSLVKDIGLLSEDDLPCLAYYSKIHIHASPDCTTYSIAAISTHRDNGKPKTDYAAKCDAVNAHFIKMIDKIEMSFLGSIVDFTYSIENPRGYMRKMYFMHGLPRYTVWYCQYGDDRAKPTDIWTNLNWIPRPVCHNGNTNCHHQPAPRGSKTGTQGRKGSYERSKIPNELCKELIESIDNPVKIKTFTPQQLSII